MVSYVHTTSAIEEELHPNRERLPKPYLAIFRVKISGLVNTFRKIYFKSLGLKIGSGGSLGKITCVWPQQVVIGSNGTIQDRVDFRIGRPFSKNNFIKIGDRIFLGRDCEFNCSGRIVVGNDVMIGSNTIIVDVGHEINVPAPINTQPCTIKDIVINDDVWIGTKCVILQGVEIGKGSVIGAGSMVNRSVPEYEVWAGCPARFIKKRN
ncbi:MAG: acyltransferase [Chitinophagaceae bacterium]